jgi:hypothetical protein
LVNHDRWTDANGYRMCENEAVFNICEGLPMELPFHIQKMETIKDIRLAHCSSDTELIEAYLKRWPMEAIIARQIYFTMQPLVLLRNNDPLANDLSIRDSLLARLSTRNVKLAGYLIQATRAFAWALNKEIPEQALLYLDGWTQDLAHQYMTITLSQTQQETIRKRMASEGLDKESDDNHSLVQLGSLIESWALAEA